MKYMFIMKLMPINVVHQSVTVVIETIIVQELLMKIQQHVLIEVKRIVLAQDVVGPDIIGNVINVLTHVIMNN